MNKNTWQWYSVTVTVYRNDDGHIERDCDELMINGDSADHARFRAARLLRMAHNGWQHTIIVENPTEVTK